MFPIKDLSVPDNILEKTWMDERLMTLCYEKMWLRLRRKRTKWIGFQKSLVTLVLLKSLQDVQPLDICISKPFKSFLRECWEDHVVQIVKDTRNKANNNPIFKLSFPTRQETLCFKRWFNEVCNITTANQGLVCNDSFLKRISGNTDTTFFRFVPFQ